MTKTQNPKGGQGSDSQMLNNQHQSQTFIGKREENKEKEKKKKKKRKKVSIPTFVVDFQKIFLPILKIWPLKHPFECLNGNLPL